jgi:hypothetical protein
MRLHTSRRRLQALLLLLLHWPANHHGICLH